MSGLMHSPFRVWTLVLAAVMIIPAAWLSLRHMLDLRGPDEPPRARALEALWSVVPFVGLIALLVLAGLE